MHTLFFYLNVNFFAILIFAFHFVIHDFFPLIFVGGWIILLIKTLRESDSPKKRKLWRFFCLLFFPPLALVYAYQQKSLIWKVYCGFNIIVILFLSAFSISLHVKRPYRDDQFLKISEKDTPSETAAKQAINHMYLRVNSFENAHDKKSPAGVVIFRLGRYADKLESHSIEPEGIKSALKELEPYLDDKKLTQQEVDQWVRDTMPRKSSVMK